MHLCIWVRALSRVCIHKGLRSNPTRCRYTWFGNGPLGQVRRSKYSSFQNPSLLQHTMDYQHLRQDAIRIFQASVDSVYPPQMVRSAVRTSSDGSKLIVDDREYDLNNNVYVVGFGKAVLGMARAVEDILGEHLVQGIVSVPVGSQELFQSIGKQDLCLKSTSKIVAFEGAENNMPDTSAHKAALAIQTLVTSLTEEHILLVLISGGGSALLPCPESPITLEDELQLTGLLSKQGATIQQLNILRQNIETLKGGGLAKLSYPASTLSLILSDVIDDKLDIISSGPTVPLLSSPRQCLQVLQALNVQDKVPNVILSTLKIKAEEKKAAQNAPNQKYNSGCEHVQNVVIGSNSIATTAAYNKAEDFGYIPLVLTNGLKGDARAAAKMLFQIAQFVVFGLGDMPAHKGNVDLASTEIDLVSYGISKSDIKKIDAASTKAQNSDKGLCIICGGETTVNVKGTGKGGRNQEMALAFGILLSKFLSTDKRKLFSNVYVEFLSAGTDGQDGPTDAAGAVVNKNLVPIAISSKMNPEEHLDNNDSYNLFKSLKNSDSLIQCGMTGTNVMDIQLLLIKFL